MTKLPVRKLLLVLSSIALGVIFLFVNTGGIKSLHADSTQPTATISPTDTFTDQIAVTFPTNVPQGNIADFELYDVNNQKVWQQFSTDGGTQFTKTATVAAGTYTLRVGLFTPNWGQNYAWFNTVITLTLPNNNITPSVTITPSLSVTPSPTATITASVTPTLTSQAINSSQSSPFQTAMQAYNDWKAKYVQSVDSGVSRIVRPENSNDTVSEGMGYGMLLSEMAGDQQTFGNLLAYVNRYLDAKGLMQWDINSSGVVIGQGSATDADEDIAFALVQANKKWPQAGYDSSARTFIQSIMRNEVSSLNDMTPGDNWGATQIVNPSYLAPSYYQAFASITGDARWDTVDQETNDMLAKVASAQTGLVPDWINQDLSPANLSFDQHPHDYYYDALRNPIRMLFSYKLTNNQNAATLLQKQQAFFAGIGAAKLESGYTLSGSPIGNYQDTAFLASYAAAGQINPSSQYAQDSMNLLNSKPASGYFGSSLRVLTLFISSM